MGLNRMMFVKRSAGSGGGDEPANMFVMTMGRHSGQYGYSRNNGIYREHTGSLVHDGRADTQLIIS